MLKVFLFALFVTLSASASAATQQYLPYQSSWASNFGGGGNSFAAIQNMLNVQGESDNGGMMLPPGGLKPGQYIAFPPGADFAQVYGPGANPVIQTGEMDVPMQMVNGMMIPVPKPDNDNGVDISPQFYGQPGYPSAFNPLAAANGLIPAAPQVTGQTQQYPLFVSDNSNNIYGFQGYGCLDGDCDLSDMMEANAMMNLLGGGGATSGTVNGPLATGTGPAIPATGTIAGTGVTAGTGTGVTAGTGTVATGTGATTGGTVPAATTNTNTQANAGQQFNQLMWMMGGQNPLNDENTQNSAVARNYLKTLPGGDLFAMYGTKIGDTPYGESDAFIPGPNGQPQINLDNFDRLLQKANVAKQQQPTQHNKTFTEDPFFWAFLTTFVILIAGVTTFLVRKRRSSTLEDVLMEKNYSSHV